MLSETFTVAFQDGHWQIGFADQWYGPYPIEVRRSGWLSASLCRWAKFQPRLLFKTKPAQSRWCGGLHRDHRYTRPRFKTR